MNRLLKAAFLGILSFLLISAGIFVPLLFNFYQAGQGRLAELQRQIDNRGSELSLALARLATEQWGPRGMVSVSSAMNEVVRATAGRTDEVKVKEIFIIDREGNARAHNDFTRLALESEVGYDDALQKKILRLSARNPVWRNRSQQFDPPPYYLGLFESLFPDLIHNRFVFGAAVFSLDGPIHWGGLHMTVEVNSVERVMADLVSELIQNVVIALLIALAVTAVIVALSLLLSPGGAKAEKEAKTAPAPPPYEGLEPYEDQEVAYDTPEPDEYASAPEYEGESDPYAEEELAGGRILDAIPLERTRRDRSPVGYK